MFIAYVHSICFHFHIVFISLLSNEYGEKNMNFKNVNKEKMFEIEMAKLYGQEFVDKIKKLPDETTHDDTLHHAKRYE